jgi:hypothetical protein
MTTASHIQGFRAFEVSLPGRVPTEHAPRRQGSVPMATVIGSGPPALGRRCLYPLTF